MLQDAVADAAAETFRAGRNLLTPHRIEDYPGIQVVQVGQWSMRVMVPEDGQTIQAKGGETVYAYELPDGTNAQGFTLRAGDQATRLRSDLPHALAEWRVARAVR